MIIDEKIDIPREVKHTRKFLAQHRYEARKFVFSDEATIAIAELLRDYPELLIRNYQFALPPYPTIYIEWNSLLFHRHLGPYFDATDSADLQVGFLIHDHSVIVLSKNEKGTSISPWLWQLNGEGLHSGFWHLPMRTELKMAMVWGSTLSTAEDHFTNEIEDDIDRRVHLWVDRHIDYPTIRKLIPSFQGEVRIFWAFLLWLNQPKHLFFDEVPRRRGILKGREIVYAAHHIVRIKPSTQVTHLAAALKERTPPRRHEVRAFWRHINTQKGCEHDWPILPDDNGHWICQKCGGKRLRVREHLRGDASRGFVTKEYKA